MNASPYAYISRAASQLRCSRRKRDAYVEWEIEYEDLHRIYDEQEGLCALTGVKMTHYRDGSGIPNPDNISIDRIDPEGSYNKSNIQLVCHHVNMMKWILTNEQFKEICHRVADRHPL